MRQVGQTCLLGRCGGIAVAEGWLRGVVGAPVNVGEKEGRPVRDVVVTADIGNLRFCGRSLTSSPAPRLAAPEAPLLDIVMR